MKSTASPATTRWAAAIVGVAAFVVFTLASGATRQSWSAGLLIGALVGVGVGVAWWFVMPHRR
jgi:hypothetical protein